MAFALRILLTWSLFNNFVSIVYLHLEIDYFLLRVWKAFKRICVIIFENLNVLSKRILLNIKFGIWSEIEFYLLLLHFELFLPIISALYKELSQPKAHYCILHFLIGIKNAQGILSSMTYFAISYLYNCICCQHAEMLNFLATVVLILATNVRLSVDRMMLMTIYLKGLGMRHDLNIRYLKICFFFDHFLIHL